MKIPDNAELLGMVAVDSGQMLLVDPCYIKTEDPSDPDFWKEDCEFVPGVDPNNHPATPEQIAALPHGYSQCCAVTLSPKRAGQVMVAGAGGTGVATSTAYGDGRYPVYRVVDGDSHLVVIDFS